MNEAGLKFTYSKVINSQIIVVQFMYNQQCLLFVKNQSNDDNAILLPIGDSQITFPVFPSQAYRLPSSPKLQPEYLSLNFSSRHWPSTGLMVEK